MKRWAWVSASALALLLLAGGGIYGVHWWQTRGPEAVRAGGQSLIPPGVQVTLRAEGSCRGFPLVKPSCVQYNYRLTTPTEAEPAAVLEGIARDGGWTVVTTGADPERAEVSARRGALSATLLAFPHACNGRGSIRCLDVAVDVRR